MKREKELFHRPYRNNTKTVFSKIITGYYAAVKSGLVILDFQGKIYFIASRAFFFNSYINLIF